MKNYAPLCMIFLLLLTGCSLVVEYIPESVPLATAENPPYTSITAPPKESPEPLSPEIPLCDALYHALIQFQPSVCFNYKIDIQEMSHAVGELERQHPEIFWINGYSMRYNDNFAELDFKIINDYSPEDLQRMCEELQAAEDAILQEISPDLSDYDKILQIHDYLITHTVYDESAAHSGKGLWSTAYGCLIEGKAVCQGYAQAFQILLNRLGIECGICSGNADGEAHAWNYVKLHDQYYWVDVTWNDPVSETSLSADWIHHNYFLINDEMLFRSRTLDEDQFYPECTSLEDNYFVHSGNYFTEYDFSELDHFLSEHLADGRIEIMFADKATYEAAVSDLFDHESIWNAQIFQKTGGTINFQQDPDMYILRLVFHVNP